ncbi:hypothetical protein MTsPCn9_35170 [Croceitalea sp. MTPC9]|uniref:DUF6876 family protein n=1 Tax=Bacteroidota TaxID=976 RepID=UPI002B3D84DC|nr:hypothetical protein MTsPCn6_34980 [Croceitalea sp. MTPC6]GMN18577.1 hypothetical protein MTsPCn9_35170 [Croceitalea sp. MTPC9]
METTLSPQEIRENLAQFHGTENFYKHPLCNVIWTDGAQYVIDSCNAHWLVSDVSIQCDALKDKSEFIKVQLSCENEKGTLEYTNGNGKLLHVHEYRYTDFPLDVIAFYYTNGTLLLPSEY